MSFGVWVLPSTILEYDRRNKGVLSTLMILHRFYYEHAQCNAIGGRAWSTQWLRVIYRAQSVWLCICSCVSLRVCVDNSLMTGNDWGTFEDWPTQAASEVLFVDVVHDLLPC